MMSLTTANCAWLLGIVVAGRKEGRKNDVVVLCMRYTAVYRGIDRRRYDRIRIGDRRTDRYSD